MLRVYPEGQPEHKATLEACVQSALARAGFPAPRVLDLCLDASVLGERFLLMERLRGQPLVEAPVDASSRVLGETHAHLHAMDASPVIAALRHQGLDRFWLADRLDLLRSACAGSGDLERVCRWLDLNRPAHERLAVCHGDFHKMNVLQADGLVTGIVDWSGFSVGDPEYDVAQTLLIFEVVAPQRISAGDFVAVDLENVLTDYLRAYRALRPLDDAKLAYYRAVRCTRGLVRARAGHPHWSDPAVVASLIEMLRGITGLDLNPFG